MWEAMTAFSLCLLPPYRPSKQHSEHFQSLPRQRWAQEMEEAVHCGEGKRGVPKDLSALLGLLPVSPAPLPGPRCGEGQSPRALAECHPRGPAAQGREQPVCLSDIGMPRDMQGLPQNSGLVGTGAWCLCTWIPAALAGRSQGPFMPTVPDLPLSAAAVHGACAPHAGASQGRAVSGVSSA